jgi:repressor LexA
MRFSKSAVRSEAGMGGRVVISGMHEGLVVSEGSVRMGMSALSAEIAGLMIEGLAQPDSGSLEIRFTDSSVLVIRSTQGGLTALLRKPRRPKRGEVDPSRPTTRQWEYLEFIKKYMHRFGVAPAETDVQRHFLVSAPSVNQMMRTLERRGFISRDKDWSGQTVPRSIRVLWDC